MQINELLTLYACPKAKIDGSFSYGDVIPIIDHKIIWSKRPHAVHDRYVAFVIVRFSRWFTFHIQVCRNLFNDVSRLREMLGMLFTIYSKELRRKNGMASLLKLKSWKKKYIFICRMYVFWRPGSVIYVFLSGSAIYSTIWQISNCFLECARERYKLYITK